MPALERISIEFEDSNEGRGHVTDLEAIRNALCGIESTRLRHAHVRTILPLWCGTLPKAWVSPGPSVANLAVGLRVRVSYTIARHSGFYLSGHRADHGHFA
jgi:hypothetical protein